METNNTSVNNKAQSFHASLGFQSCLVRARLGEISQDFSVYSDWGMRKRQEVTNHVDIMTAQS